MMPDAPTKKQHRCLEQDMHSDTATFGKNLTPQQHNPHAPKVPRCDRLAASDTVKSVRLVQLSWGGAGHCRPSRPPKLFTGLWVICSFCRSAQHHHTGPFRSATSAPIGVNFSQQSPTWTHLAPTAGPIRLQDGAIWPQVGPICEQIQVNIGSAWGTWSPQSEKSSKRPFSLLRLK